MSLPAKKPTRYRSGLIGAVLLFAAVPARAATFKVGPDAGCTHATLAAALSAAAGSPGQDQIRLLSNTSHQGMFLLLNNPVDLVGGWASCTAAVATDFSTLLGTNGQPALVVIASANHGFRRLILTGGSNVGGSGGGGMGITGTGLIELDTVQIFGNSVIGRGGNVYVDGSDGLTVRIRFGSLLTASTATDGGGLACVGDAEITLDETSAIANNQATGNGGGVYLAESCFFKSMAGGNLAGIANNTAGGAGGGIYLEGESMAQLFGTTNALAALSGNYAELGGGGVFATGVNTIFQAYSGAITGNTTNDIGGGLALLDGAGAFLVRDIIPSAPCPDSVRCSLLSDNESLLYGGALYVGAGSSATVAATFVEGNRATSFGSIALLEGDSTVTFSSAVLAANDGPNPLAVDASTLILGNASVIDNTAVGSGLIQAIGASTTVKVLTSLFSQSGALFAPPPAGLAPQLDCVMSAQASLLTGLPPATVQRAVVVADPQLIDPAAKRYQLRDGSPAIDFCDLSQWAGDHGDFEGEGRDFDDPVQANGMPGGFRDLGADEHQPFFADGFESGDTSAWTQTVP